MLHEATHVSARLERGLRPARLLAFVAIDDTRAFVRELRAARLELDLSCEEVDELAGLTRGYTNKLENFESPSGREPGWRSGLRIARALGLRLMLAPDNRSNG